MATRFEKIVHIVEKIKGWADNEFEPLDRSMIASTLQIVLDDLELLKKEKDL
ncbi:hypothetical protein [[Mycoplasma] testudinis]|uniref:hypothetical protein n=1 Tax=[Mycoplasma] testudinis TaxID=33924 RepID=UPI000A47FBC6|nr:hypothetical protein [[Mycoplasma] testudinis]